jgi:DNA-binding XRE family transcriptional regulator
MDSGRSALARAIIARRRELEMSLEEAAALANVSEASWKVIERGTSSPSLLMLGAICRALDWTPDTIESLLHGELRIEEGEKVVDLAGSPEPPEPPAEPVRAAELDVEGLTPVQLKKVQAYIDDLRGTSRDS